MRLSAQSCLRSSWFVFAWVLLAASPTAAVAAAPTSTATSAGLQRAARAGAVVSVANQDDPTAITFDDYGVGTTITDQYSSRGVAFTSPVFLTTDGSNPTEPVLSGSPKFFGDIVGHFTLPGTTIPTTVNGFSFDVGFIDDRNSVEIDYYDASGAQVGSTRAQSFGINEIDVSYRGVASFKVSAVEYEAAGFAIDNLVIHTGVKGIRPLRMAEFGDSYSSGEGLVPEKGLSYDCGTDLQEGRYREGTTVPALISVWGGSACITSTGSTKDPGFKDLLKRKSVVYENLCHRHGRAYPNQIREKLGISSANAIFVACSGATTAHVLSQGQYPNSPPGVHGGEPQLKTVQNFAAAGAPQLITIGIGGNDAGFGGIIKHCALALTSCADPGWAGGVISRVNRTMYDNVKSTFTALTIAFPEATIVAFGYPSVIDDPNQACVFGIDATEMAWLKYALLPAVNEAIKDATTDTGITYVDTTAATLGHGICSPEPWINGVRAGDDRVKIGFLSPPKVVANESFHPNQRAHDAIAQLFIDHYTDGGGNLLFVNPPREKPIRVFAAPELQVGNLEVGSVQPCGAGCRQPVPCLQGCAINVQGSNFDPGSVLSATLHSDPVPLGQVVADGFGRIDATFKAPPGTPPGLHLLTLEGLAPNGTREDAIEEFRIYGRTRAKLRAKLGRVEGGSVVRVLKVLKATPGSRVDVVCAKPARRTLVKALLGRSVSRGGGCPFAHRHFELTAKGGKRAKQSTVKRDFAGLFKRPLAPHTVLRIVVSNPYEAGRSLDVVIHRRGAPKLLRKCTEPGRVLPVRC